jgi:hypothetical protein
MNANDATSTAENISQALLPFAEADLLRVRIRPSEFARLMETDKSTVSRWIARNLISLGADGRLDPNQAMRQLLRNGDGARLRVRLVRRAFADLGDLRAEAARVASLEAALDAARADAEFNEAAASELAEQVDSLLRHFRDDWRELARLPASTVRAAIDAWQADLDAGDLDWTETSILDMTSSPDDEEMEGGMRASGESEGGGAA